MLSIAIGAAVLGFLGAFISYEWTSMRFAGADRVWMFGLSIISAVLVALGVQAIFDLWTALAPSLVGGVVGWLVMWALRSTPLFHEVTTSTANYFRPS